MACEECPALRREVSELRAALAEAQRRVAALAEDRTAEVQRLAAELADRETGPSPDVLTSVALYLAKAFIESRSDETRTWARGLVCELKYRGADIADEVGRHMQQIAIGDPDIPF